MKTITIHDPHCFPQAMADSRSQVVIVLHDSCRFVLSRGKVLSCGGTVDTDVEPVTVEAPMRDATGRTGAVWFVDDEVRNDLPTLDDLAVVGLRDIFSGSDE